jgi:hypothetical protein
MIVAKHRTDFACQLKDFVKCIRLKMAESNREFQRAVIGAADAKERPHIRWYEVDVPARKARVSGCRSGTLLW